MEKRKYVKINKLFGKYDNEIDLSSRGIIFIGENGVGKTTIMKILQNLMNFNFAEIIKYDFESIDIEVSAKNGKILQETIKYEDLLPTDEEIKECIKKSDLLRVEMEDEWDEYKDKVPDEEKIKAFYDDSSLTDEEKIEIWNEFDFDIAYSYYESGDIISPTNDILNDIINKNELKNIIRKIIKEEEFNNLYYDNYINKLSYEAEYKIYKINTFDSQSYQTIKSILENIIVEIKEFLDNRLSLKKEIDFNNKEKITRMIKIINDNVDKPVTILDMTKVYNFDNKLLESSLIRHKLLDWMWMAPTGYQTVNKLKRDIYKNVFEDLKENNFYYIESNLKDISELNINNTIEINNIINYYYYDSENYDFLTDINKKALEYYLNYTDGAFFITSEKSIEEDKNQKYIRDRFNKYIRPIIIRNCPFDKDFTNYRNMEEKMFLDFCTKEWFLFEKNTNPKIKILQELLNKYMMNKDVEVTPMGLLVKSKEDNRNIPLNSLSSGEKKLLVIFMHCLFNEDVPIIIDEPEISLSIIWQENLLPDLLEKTRIKQVIVATHSSAVISDSSLDKYIIPLPNSIVDKGGNSSE